MPALTHNAVALACVLLSAHATHAFAAGPADLVETDRLMATVRALPAKRSAVGTPEHKQGLRDTEAWLVEQLKALGLSPVLHEFVWGSPGATLGDADDAPEAPATWHNITVDLPGTTSPTEVLLISAHFDAVPMGPGADDDATGTAAILELARVLKDVPHARTIRLALFNLEEVGLVGSTAYVKQWRTDHPPQTPQPPGEPAPGPARETIVGMMSLEMLGYYSDEPNSQRSPIKAQPGVFEPPTVGDSLAVVGLARDKAFITSLAGAMRRHTPDLKLTVVDFLPVAIPDMTRSDHRPFLAAKVPAVMLTDTADFRNPHYHKATDTIDTLDPRRFTLAVRAIAGAAAELAGAPAQEKTEP